MKEELLEQIIQAEKSRPLPICPRDMESRVLRRVRLADRMAEKSGGLDWILGLLPRGGMVLSALAMTVAFSTVASMVLTANHASAAETQSRAVHALDFGIFKDHQVLNLDR